MKTKRIISLAELAITVLYIILCTVYCGSLPHSMSCTSYLIPHYYDFSIYVLTVIVFVALTLFKGCNRKERIMVWLMIIGRCVASVVYVSHRAPKLLWLWVPCFIICVIYPPCHILFEEFFCLLEMVLLNLLI